ncbi:MAG: flagellar basal body rod protein FlgB [Leptospiraceae bacterium]|nr:flagellar basal body rod protein FlgB [Leptospiraceae bacterium]MDW7974928.1 flagellar basal body rod protein FlgB [Leptospiraceae bacterium]
MRWDTIHLMEKALKTNVIRLQVTANNIANVDVPGFKRSEVAFEVPLKRAIEKQKQIEQEPPLRTIHPEHIAKRTPPDWRKIEPRVYIDYLSTMRNDGNNVDIEDEVMKLTRTQLHYSLIADRISGKFNEWNQFIRLA